MLTPPTTADLLPRDEAKRLGVLADATDRFDLMRAIERCDELVSQLRATQLMHSQNLCRVANHLAYDEPSAKQVAEYIAEHGAPRCTYGDDCQVHPGDRTHGFVAPQNLGHSGT